MKVYNLWESITTVAYLLFWIILTGGTFLLEKHFNSTVRHYTDLNKGPLEMLLYFAVIVFNFLILVWMTEGFRKFRGWAKSVEIQVPEKINWLPVKFRKV